MVGKVDDKGNEGNEGKELKAIMDGMANLTKVVGSLATGLESTQKNVTDLTSNINSLSSMNKEQLEAQRIASEEGNIDDELDANALEGMNRGQFMNHILGKVEKGFSTLSEQITGQLSGVKDNLDTSNLKGELKSVREENTDFDHYKVEIADIAKANPDMKIQDMYTLAKANNPEKVAEVTKILDAQKIENDKLATEEVSKNKGKASSFGGLTPTSGQRMDKPSDMDQGSAANAAWDEAMNDIELGEQ